MTSDINVPARIRSNVVKLFGDRGLTWIETAPKLAESLAVQWDLTLGTAFADGSHSLVLPAVRADDSRAALKIPFQDTENYGESAALRAYDGDGAVRLYEFDPDSGAMLMELADPGTPLIDLPNRAGALDIACGLLRRLRRPSPDGLPRARDLAADWASKLQRDTIAPAPLRHQAIEAALEFSTSTDDEFLVNRDAHLGNIVAAEREPWLLIDPKPVTGEAAFDASHLLAQNAEDYPDTTELVDRISGGIGVERERVRRWALVRAVENVVWSNEVGHDPSRFLAAASALSTA